VTESWRIRVPATSANLGPLFDSGGLALNRYDLVDVELAESLQVQVTGMGAGTLPADERHLVVRAFRAACDQLGWHPPGIRLTCANGIPQGRGMGSSAAAVVAGVLAAWALCPDAAPDDAAVLRLVTELEGHPDNVAPCLLGGVTLAFQTPGGVVAERLAVDGAVAPVLLVPPATLSTELARGLLPAQVPHADAAYTAGRAALLVHALTRDPALLFDATEDRLHQDQRAPAMPASAALLRRLRDAGQAAVVSGAGPSLLVLTVRRPGEPAGTVPADLAALVEDEVGAGWQVLPLEIDQHGAHATRADHAVS
jgi:homoserine kinase